MRIHRIHTEQELEPEAETVLRGNPAHYLTRVLRIVPGQVVVLFNGDGSDYAAEVTRPGKNELYLKVLSRLPVPLESPFRINLAQAISRGERMDLTLQKCTELGVSSFQPLVTERVEVRIHPDRLQKRMQHWRQVVISACEQCGRAIVPVLFEPLGLAEWLDRPADLPRLLLEPTADKPLACAGFENGAELLIGPEGGFSEMELALLQRNGVHAFNMGPRILRTETAGPAAVAVLQTVFGDFGGDFSRVG